MTLPWHSPTYNDQFTLFSQLLAPIAPGPGDGARQALGGTGMSCCDDTSRMSRGVLHQLTVARHVVDGRPPTEWFGAVVVLALAGGTQRTLRSRPVVLVGGPFMPT
jgi:hypothetical protein